MSRNIISSKSDKKIIIMFSLFISLVSDTKKPPPVNTTSMCAKENKAKSALKNNTYMAPSSIYHIYTGVNNILSVEINHDILEVSRKIIATGDLPKLQVVRKDGNWFALNNAQLDLCRILEKDGQFANVKVDILSLCSVPKAVRDMMKVPEEKHMDNTDEDQSSCSSHSRTTAKGYERLEQAEEVDEEDLDHMTESDTDETCSESSDFEESDSECDWSESDQDSIQMDRSGSEDDQSSEDEQECLL